MLLLNVYLSFVTCCTLFLSHYILLHKCMLYWPSWNWPTYKFYDSVVKSTPAQCIPIIYYHVHLHFISLLSHMRYGTIPLTAKQEGNILQNLRRQWFNGTYRNVSKAPILLFILLSQKFSESPRIQKLSSATLVALIQPKSRYYMIIVQKLSSDTLRVPSDLTGQFGQIG